MRFSPADLRILKRCIVEAESLTEAELAFVVRGASGNYRDVDYLFGALTSFGLLLFFLFSSAEIPESAIPLPLVICFFFSAGVCKRLKLRRYLTSTKRRLSQVHRAALHLFYGNHVDQTKSHAGILIYLSLLEKQVELVLDHHAEQALGREDLEEFRKKLILAIRLKKPAHELGSVIRSFGVLLRRKMPATKSSHSLALQADISFEAEE